MIPSPMRFRSIMPRASRWPVVPAAPFAGQVDGCRAPAQDGLMLDWSRCPAVQRVPGKGGVTGGVHAIREELVRWLSVLATGRGTSALLQGGRDSRSRQQGRDASRVSLRSRPSIERTESDERVPRFPGRSPCGRSSANRASPTQKSGNRGTARRLSRPAERPTSEAPGPAGDSEARILGYSARSLVHHVGAARPRPFRRALEGRRSSSVGASRDPARVTPRILTRQTDSGS